MSERVSIHIIMCIFINGASGGEKSFLLHTQGCAQRVRCCRTPLCIVSGRLRDESCVQTSL